MYYYKYINFYSLYIVLCFSVICCPILLLVLLAVSFTRVRKWWEALCGELMGCKYVDVPMTLNPESHTQYTIELSFISAQARLYLDGQASIYYLRLLGQKKQ